ncbi:dienelactone hydrolase [Cadophora sp. MPI-SDFR-AT-0126]|nr:dienelactone hydrolase [Leotiomycetes sp. MPI-SDFR-AT-0126]
MAANPPGACCTIGVKHEGEASGEIKRIGNVESYFAYPPDRSTAKAIVLLTDVIGHKLINAQLLADQLAANGYFTVVPDLFHENPAPLNPPEGFNIYKWLEGFPPEKIDPIVQSTISNLRKTYGAKTVGAAGYCFGGKYVIRALKDRQIDAGYAAHPSMVDAAEFGAIAGPLSLSAAETDQIWPTDKRHESEVILAKTGQPYQINLFSGVEHGFAVRGDLSKEQLKFAKEQAFLQAVAWFDKYLK